jgi:hypothetical protein
MIASDYANVCGDLRVVAYGYFSVRLNVAAGHESRACFNAAKNISGVGDDACKMDRPVAMSVKSQYFLPEKITRLYGGLSAFCLADNASYRKDGKSRQKSLFYELF